MRLNCGANAQPFVNAKIIPALALLIATLSFAIPTVQASNAAATDSGFYCGLSFDPYGAAITNTTSWVLTSSNHGMLICQFANGSFSNTGKAARMSNFPCSTFAGLTYNTYAVVNSTGGALLQCKY